MTTPGPSDWPEDVEALARLASDPAQPLVVRQGAFEQLRPVIRRAARRVAARFVGQYREDILTDAESDVWKALVGSEQGGFFEGWCCRVLRNGLIDRFRKERRELTHREEAASRAEPPDLHAALERALDRPGQLPASDLDVLRTWPLPQRLALLCLCGLWDKVPPQEWEQWLRDYRDDWDAQLPSPFPSPELDRCERIAERNAILCEAMKMQRNTLSVWLYRFKARLRALHYVRNLIGNP
jgi:hypothetical protein